jgi:hypothetical protein
VQAATAVHRPELGVLDERCGAGLDATLGVGGQLAGLGRVQRGQFGSRGADRGRRGVQGSTPLGGRGPGPARCGIAGGLDGGGAALGGGHRHPTHLVAGAGVVDGQLAMQRRSHVLPYPLGRGFYHSRHKP